MNTTSQAQQEGESSQGVVAERVTIHPCREPGVQELSFLPCSWKDASAETAILLLILLTVPTHLHCISEDLTTGVNVGIKRCCNGGAKHVQYSSCGLKSTSCRGGMMGI